MEFKTTLEIVTKDIQDIEKLVGNFKNYSRIPNIELDLALSRLRNVYDLLLMFRDDSQTDILIPAPKTLTERIDTSTEVVVPEKTAIAIPSEPVNATTSVIKNKIKTDPETSEKNIVGQRPSVEKKFINEKLGEQTSKKDISSKLQSQAIKSISGSLGINDKFLFIRELFAGNAESFRHTMDELDDARNFNDAYSLLSDKFQWDMDSETVQMLLNLIRRKFITSGNE